MTALNSQYEPPASCSSASSRAGVDIWSGALVHEVEPGSPAQREGLEAGMLVTHVNGCELRDMIDWDWEADGPEVDLEGVAYPGTPDEFEFECHMERSWGEDWGVVFDGAVFDGMRTCRNNCSFCFMKMLPKGMRKTLYLRDDDYRLSFLQGNFVTLTNMTDDDVSRVIDRALSPLNVSLHAVSPDVRARIMGKNAARGLEVLESLLRAGIEVHAQVVLVPHENDGEELRKTLDYVEARPLITSLGIVPLGFTKHQSRFASSFNDPHAARQVIDLVAPYQARSREKKGRTRFQLADEFYLSAHMDPPPAQEYDGYPQYQDGIGMVRSFLDEAAALLADPVFPARVEALRRSFERRGVKVVLVSGEASWRIVDSLVQRAGLGQTCRVLPVRNDYFGGNVDVTGLLTATDVLGQLPDDLRGVSVLLPDIMLNTDRLTLDGVGESEVVEAIGARGGNGFFMTALPESILAALECV